MGVYNGQEPIALDKNKNLNIVSRITYPFELPTGQFLEASFQGYTGKYIVYRNVNTDFDQDEFQELRYGPSFVIYPQPFGLQAEYNWGKGPQFNPETNDVWDAPIRGGYVLASNMKKTGQGAIIPFTRYHYFSGGKKFEIDATRHRINELEIGVEWQFNKAFELVTMYTISDRSAQNSRDPFNREKGSLLRIQAQVNF